MATLGNVIKRIKRDLRASNGLRLSDSDVIDAVNDAIRHYRATRFHFNEANGDNGLGKTITTVVGQAAYAFPAGVLELDHVLYLQDSYNYPLEQWTYQEHLTAIGDTTTARGPIKQYAIHGNRIHAFPPPDRVTTITLTGLVELTPTPLSGLTTENAWLTTALSLIRARASWDLSINTMANPDRAQDFKGVEREALNSIRWETTTRITTGKALVEDWATI